MIIIGETASLSSFLILAENGKSMVIQEEADQDEWYGIRSQILAILYGWGIGFYDSL